MDYSRYVSGINVSRFFFQEEIMPFYTDFYPHLKKEVLINSLPKCGN